MSERERHTTTALAAAAERSPHALAALLRSDDSYTLSQLRRLAAREASVRGALEAHPSTRVQGVWWALRIEEAGVRRRSTLAREAGSMLDARGVEALLEVARVRGDREERWRKLVVSSLLARPELDWEPLLVLLEEHVEEWESSTELLAGVMRAKLPAREERLRAARVLEVTQWRGMGSLAVAVSGDVAVWGSCQLEYQECVVALRRLVTDSLVADSLAGRGWAASVSAPSWTAAAQVSASASVLRVAGERVSGEAEEAIRQSILAAASSASAEEISVLLGLAGSCGVSLSSGAVYQSRGEMEQLHRLVSSSGASSWDPGSVSEEVCDQLLAHGQLPIPGVAGARWGVLQEALAKGSGWEEAIGAIEALARACRSDKVLREEIAEDVSEAVARACVELRLPEAGVLTLVEFAGVEALDTLAHELERSDEGDARFVLLASHVPYICDPDDLSRRRRRAVTARGVLAALCAPGFTPRGMIDSDHELSHWRRNAVSVCSESVSLRAQEIEALPWQHPAGERTAAAVGAHLAKRLDGHPGAWEVLAGISDSFEGSVGELIDSVLACS